MRTVEVQTIQTYTPEVAAGLGRLLPELSSSFGNNPVSSGQLEEVINSPLSDQLIAVTSGAIVGAATVSLLPGIEPGRRKAWMDTFVVTSSLRGQGVADKLWDGVVDWCVGREVNWLEFTSNSKRVAAQRFYEKMGAIMISTDVFRFLVDQSPSTDL